MERRRSFSDGHEGAAAPAAAAAAPAVAAAAAASNGLGAAPAAAAASSAPPAALQSLLLGCGFDLAAALDDAKKHKAQHLTLHEPGHLSVCLDSALQAAGAKERKAQADAVATAVESIAAQTDDTTWLLMLQPTVPRAATAIDVGRASHLHVDSYLQQPSLLRILLCNEFLQTQLVPVVMERLGSIEHAQQRERQPGSGDDSVSVECRLLLTSLRYLDQIVDTDNFAKGLEDTINNMQDRDVQRDTIAAVPAILGASASYSSLVQSLLDLRESHSELTAVVLDTVGSLALDDKTQNDNLSQLLASVSSAAEMPSVVSFILQQAGTRSTGAETKAGRDGRLSLQDIVDQLRAGLNHSQLVSMSESVSSHQARNTSGSGGGGFKSRQPGHHARRGESAGRRAGAASAASSSSSVGVNDSDMAAPFLVFDSLRQAFRHHPAIAAAWFKSIAAQSKKQKKGSSGSRAHTDVLFDADVWALLLLFATPMRNQAGDFEGKVLKLIRDKITSGALTLSLLERAVEKHPDVLAMLFHDLLRVADSLLRTHDAQMRSAGARMQSAAFRGFTDQFDRNTVIDQFRTQIADKSDTQAADAALAELYLLCQRDPQAVYSFHAHLSGLQEQLLHFSDEQLRCLMDILAMMQVQTSSDGQLSVGGNIKSLCSKHLGAAVYRMHQIGVVAAVAVMRAVGGVRVTRDDEGYLQRGLRGSNAVALFGSLWDELHHSLSNIPASSTRIAAFFDLMAATVESGNLHEDVVACISSRMSEQCSQFLLSTNDSPESLHLADDDEDEDHAVVRACSWMGLAPDAASFVAILPFVARAKLRSQLPLLPAAFRLMFACSKQSRRLDELRALITSPLLMYRLLGSSTFSNGVSFKTQSVMMSATFHAINYVREVVSAFSFDPGMRVEANTRLTHLLCLESQLRLQVSLAQDLSFLPFGLPHEQIEAARDAEARRAEQELKRQANAKKAKKQTKKKEDKIDYMQHLTLLLRPLHPSVFHLLSLPLSFGKDPCAEKAFELPTSCPPGRHPVVPLANARLPVNSLRFLLRLLLEHMKAAEGHGQSPLAAVLNTRPERDDDGLVDRSPAPDAHSSEQMSPVELVRSLMPVLPMLGRALLSLTEYDSNAPSKSRDDDGDESGDVDAGGPDACVLHDSIDSLVGVCRFLFEDPSLQAEPRVQKRAIAALVKQIEGVEQPKKNKSNKPPAAAAAAAAAESKESEQMEMDDGGAAPAAAAAAAASPASPPASQLSQWSAASQPSAVASSTGAASASRSWLQSCLSVIHLLDKAIVSADGALSRVVLMLEALELVLSVAKRHDPVHVSALEQRVSGIAWSCLTREWGDVVFKKGNVGKIVRIYLHTQADHVQGCSALLDQMQRILSATEEWRGVGDLELDEELVPLTCTFNAPDSALFLVPMIETISQAVCAIDLAHYADDARRQFTVQMRHYTNLFHRTIQAVQTAPMEPALLAAVMKHGRIIIDRIVKLEDHWNAEMKGRKKLLSVLVDGQHIRRYLLNVIGHAKSNRVGALTTSIPSVSASLDRFVTLLRVLSTEHKLKFQIASLQSKDVTGEALPEDRVGLPLEEKKARKGHKRKADEDDEADDEGDEGDEEDDAEVEEEQDEIEGQEEDDDDSAHRSKKARNDASHSRSAGAAAAAAASSRSGRPTRPLARRAR